ncbi:hypothetical protein BH10ACT3_BH10ACT3_22950 [soil metagenome]
MIFVAVLAFSAANAGAATNDDAYVGAEVLSATATNSAAAPQAAAVKSATVSNSALAFTGSDALGLTIIGAVAVAGGASLLLVRRRATN